MPERPRAPRRARRNPVGRPPAADSAETRRRILRAARTCFGSFGYDKTTNRHIADAAQITTGAIYHYFSSKQELFAAAYRETLELVFAAFAAAADKERSLIAKIEAFLDAAVELHAADQSLAAFAATSPVELQRHPELADLVAVDAFNALAFFERLVNEADGDLGPGVDRQAVANFLIATVLGLAQFAAAANSIETHRAVTEAFKGVIHGTLFARPASNGRRRPAPATPAR